METAPTKVEERTFSKIASELDIALRAVETRKHAFQKATDIVTQASDEYQKSVQVAQGLRNELSNNLAGVLPAGDVSRVTVSG